MQKSVRNSEKIRFIETKLYGFEQKLRVIPCQRIRSVFREIRYSESSVFRHCNVNE